MSDELYEDIPYDPDGFSGPEQPAPEPPECKCGNLLGAESTMLGFTECRWCRADQQPQGFDEWLEYIVNLDKSTWTYKEIATDDNKRHLDYLLRRIVKDTWQASAQRYKKLMEQMRMLCQKFVDKVESGRARSKETYADCKAMLAALEELGEGKIAEVRFTCAECGEIIYESDPHVWAKDHSNRYHAMCYAKVINSGRDAFPELEGE